MRLLLLFLLFMPCATAVEVRNVLVFSVLAVGFVFYLSLAYFLFDFISFLFLCIWVCFSFFVLRDVDENKERVYRLFEMFQTWKNLYS